MWVYLLWLKIRSQWKWYGNERLHQVLSFRNHWFQRERLKYLSKTLQGSDSLRMYSGYLQPCINKHREILKISCRCAPRVRALLLTYINYSCELYTSPKTIPLHTVWPKASQTCPTHRPHSGHNAKHLALKHSLQGLQQNMTLGTPHFSIFTTICFMEGRWRPRCGAKLTVLIRFGIYVSSALAVYW